MPRSSLVVSKMAHQPVLLKEVVAGLAPQVGETVVDVTINRGGHAKELGRLIGSSGILVGLDQDAIALETAEQNLQELPCRKILLNGNFRQVAKLLAEKGIESADCILFDLGWSSDQLASSGRGFSFLTDEPLLMTLGVDPSQYVFTARDIVNDWDEEHIVDILSGYGEESYAKRIAHQIILAREEKPIETTLQLAEIIKRAVPIWYRRAKIHPATKTFQALRITVNDELVALREGLAGAWSVLAPGGRLAVISFHSLEARLVKEFFLSKKQVGEGELISKRAIKPTNEEIISNPRSRSAQLRLIKKI